MRRAYIRDFAFNSPLGSQAGGFADALFSGQSGIVSVENIMPANFPVKSLGLLRDSSVPRSAEALTHAQELLRSVLRANPEPIDGIIFAIPSECESTGFFSERQADTLNLVVEKETGAKVPLAQIISIHEACVSGLTALAMAAQRIRSGKWKNALVVVVDMRSTWREVLDFHRFGALSLRPVSPERASCPFSRERDGFVKAEGSAAFLLSDREEHSLGEIAGFAQTSDAWRLLEGRPDNEGALAAFDGALKSSQLRVQDIDCFSAHATSTRAGDILETRAIKSFWGDLAYQLPVTALKSQIGHTGQASGALQVISALLMLKHQRIAPTINYQTPDPQCDLDYVPNESRPAKLNHIFCNAHAFGGQNASLILRK